MDNVPPAPAASAAAAPKSRADLLALLDRLGVAHRTLDHPAIFTVEDGRDLKSSMPGAHTKNLFLKDKKGALTLVSALADTRVDLVGLGKVIGAKGRLSFGRPDLMVQTLGVIPGAVTPFALINNSARALAHVVFDAALMVCDPIWFHPLENTASTAIAADDLLKFAENCGFKPHILDLTPAAAR